MLKSLKVENIALIQEQFIEFYEGLNVLSGETGAGKSIIINALSFALGSRADKTLIRNGADFARVTAHFLVQLDDKIKEVLTELDIEYDENIVINRKMFVDGKSEIRVNGQVLSLTMLKKLTAYLIDIYGQFEHASMLDERKHIEVLDEYGGKEIVDALSLFQSEYENLLSLHRELKELGGDERERMNRIDYLQYQINEIKMINPQTNEDEELSIKKTRMMNSEKLAEGYGATKLALDGDEYSARIAIGSARNRLQSLMNLDTSLESLTNRLYSLEAELDDIVGEVNSLCDACDYDEREFNEVDERLDSIKMLKKKYGNTIEDILDSLECAENELQKLHNSEELIKEINLKVEKTQLNLSKYSQNLTEVRQKYAKKLEQEILSELSDLGMGKSQFVVNFEACEYTTLGADKIEFMFSANLGEPIKPLNKIISGGELSRFMLAIKTTLAKINNIGTQIYDEIDAGISGHIGQVIAIKLCKIGRASQVITISHLPQIVAMADVLYKIEKYEQDNKTYSKITQLNEEFALSEIARLSGGENIGQHAMTFAKEMKEWANKTKLG